MTEYIRKFHGTLTLAERKKQAQTIKTRYPTRIPVIVDRAKKSDPLLDKFKFLVPADLSLSQFTYVVRKRLGKGALSQYEALFWYSFQDGDNNNKGQILCMSDLVANLYDQYKDDSGFLTLIYSKESTFG